MCGYERQPRVNRVRDGVPAHELLDDAILQGMKTDHREPALRRETLESRVQRNLELLEFPVDVNAQRLEHARCGMLVTFFAARHTGDHLGQLQRADERLVGAIGNDRSRDARRLPLFAELAEDPHQLRFGGRVDDVCRAHALPRAHSHVERTVVHETEPARRVVELRRGDAEVEQNAVELEPWPHVIRATGEGGEGREKNRDACISRETRPGFRHGERIAIEAQQHSIRDEPVQNSPCMSAPSKSGIEINAACPDVQAVEHLR